MKTRRRGPRLWRQLRELGAIVRMLAPYLRKHFFSLVFGAAATLALLAFRLAQPWPLKWIIDAIAASRVDALGIAAASAIFLGITAAAAYAEYGQVMILVKVGNQLVSDFRLDLFQQVLRQSLAYHERKGEGELLTRIVYDTTRLRRGVNNVLTRFFQTLVTFISVSAVLFWVDEVLGAVMAVAGTAALIVMIASGNRVREAARKNRRQEGKLASLVADELLAVRELQTFRAGEADGEAFGRLSAKSLKQESKVRRLASGMLLRVEVLTSAGLAVGLLLGARRVAMNLITPGELVLFASYAGALLPHFFRFARQAAQMGSTMASADRLQRLMQREPAIGLLAGGIETGRLRGRIEFRGVALKTAASQRTSRKWRLRDITFAVEPGERVAVLGGNGAGKSSLLRLILRLADPQHGAVLLDDTDARTYVVRALRQEMSVVLQDTVLLGRSVRENIALAKPDAAEVEILEAAERAQAFELIDRLPLGLDTIVRKQGRLFSGGERQKLAIARALLRAGSIWLLDEPTNGLDADTTERVISVLEEATRGHTTFWITHDPRLAGMLDLVLYLVDGKVRFFGRRAEFREWTSFGEQVGSTAAGPNVTPMQLR
jgi:ATP-binding cassette, subfamily B, bacterial